MWFKYGLKAQKLLGVTRPAGQTPHALKGQKLLART